MRTKQYAGLTVHVGPGNMAFTKGGKVLGTARRVNGGWSLHIPGHLWPVTDDMPTARFNKIPGDKITHTPVKGFRSWQACAHAINTYTAGQEAHDADLGGTF